MTAKHNPLSNYVTHNSPLIFGCMTLGGGWNQNPISADDIAHCHQAIDAALEAAQTREARAITALAQHGDTDEARLEDELSRAVTALEAAEALHSEKVKLAPDVHAAEATLKRVQSVEDAARADIARLKPALAALEANISRTADEAVEERLAETEQQLELAQAKLAGIEKEVAVLQKLQSVLEDARSEARDRYFEPVANELKPLLQLLWPDAELSWGDQTLLPSSLIRNGQEEPIDILSGGTKEQISLLVRLAFARMLAKQGQSALNRAGFAGDHSF